MYKKNLLVVTEKNEKIGSGHFIRSKELVKKFKKNFKTRFCLIKNIKKLNIKKYDVIFLDLKNYSLLKKIFFYKKKIVTLENFSNTKSDLNISIFDHKPNIKGLRLSGLKFAIIRNKLKKLKRKKTKKLKRPLISLGSLDRKNNLIKLNNNIKLQKINFNLFLGNYDKKKLNLNSNFKVMSRNFFETCLKNSSWCIVNGGLTLIESLFLKKAVFALPQNKIEKKFVNFLYKKKYILGNSYSKIHQPKKKEVKLVKQRIRNLVDGKGSTRISNVLKKFYD